MDTLLLDRTLWDWTLDAAGNIALASDPYAIVQDVASACRTFAGEVFYNTSMGVPYFTEAFGKAVPTPLLVARIEQVARNVPGVLSAQAILTVTKDRELTGDVQVTTAVGTFTATL